MKYSRIQAQRRNLDILISRDAFQFTDTFFPYTSGQIGSYFVQTGGVMKHASIYRGAVEDMCSLIKDSLNLRDVDVVSGGETRDWIFSGPVALELYFPHAMLYKDGRVVGAEIKGKRVFHVADLNNEGSSPKDYWKPIIESNGGAIKDIFFYVDRMEDGVGVMKELGLNGRSVVSLDNNAWDYLMNNRMLDKNVYQNIRSRMEDKDKWAREMLRSDAGFARFLELVENKSTLGKARKILTHGYPDIADELASRARDHGIDLNVI